MAKIAQHHSKLEIPCFWSFFLGSYEQSLIFEKKKVRVFSLLDHLPGGKPALFPMRPWRSDDFVGWGGTQPTRHIIQPGSTIPALLWGVIRPPSKNTVLGSYRAVRLPSRPISEKSAVPPPGGHWWMVQRGVPHFFFLKIGDTAR